MDRQQHEHIKKSLDLLEVDIHRFKEILRMEEAYSGGTTPEHRPTPEIKTTTAGGRRLDPASMTAAKVAMIRRRNGASTTTSRITPVRYITTPDVDDADVAMTSGAARPAGRRHHSTTLAVISLDTPVVTDEEEMESRVGRETETTYVDKHHLAPPHSPYFTGYSSNGDPTVDSQPAMSDAAVEICHEGDERRLEVPEGHRRPHPRVTRQDDQSECFSWPCDALKDRPILRLAIVMFCNGILSIACAALILRIERPAQDERLKKRDDFLNTIDEMRDEIQDKIGEIGTKWFNSTEVIELIHKYSATVPDIQNYPEEIRWDMLGAQAYITSVQTTTGKRWDKPSFGHKELKFDLWSIGYGDIVPETLGGKLFTILYALVGIPIFMWYIFKLGGVFRLIVMKAVWIAVICCCPGQEENADAHSRETVETEVEPELIKTPRRRSTIPKEKLVELNHRLKQQFHEDKRFNPFIIGVILVIFLLLVALFISYMEQMDYFTSFYASFITYSAIGFGDIDIFRVSYRSSWLNLLIYGNCIHILGYMILSAWVSALLEKCGVRKF